MQRGERIFAALLGLAGLLWVFKASQLKYLDDSVPGSGFLPIWLGATMVVLVGILLWTGRGPTVQSAGRIGRVMAITAALTATVVLIEPLGFTVPVAALSIFLLRYMEREPWTTSVAVGLVTALALLLVFRVWLTVPLPRGPWGF